MSIEWVGRGVLLAAVASNLWSAWFHFKRAQRARKERDYWQQQAMNALGFCAFLSRGPGKDQLPEWVTLQAEELLPPGTTFAITDMGPVRPGQVH